IMKRKANESCCAASLLPAQEPKVVLTILSCRRSVGLEGDMAGRRAYTGSTSGRVDLERVELLRRLRRLNNVARLLDTALRIPGTNIRFGADSLMGLLPVVGDASGAIVGLAIINEARKLGLPSGKLGRMLTNLAADTA